MFGRLVTSLLSFMLLIQLQDNIKFFVDTASSIDDDLPVFRQNWSYDGKDHGQALWAQRFPPCGGNRQSPVAINTKQLKRVNGLKLIMGNYDIPIKDGFVENNGHTLQLGINSDTNRPFITGSAADNQMWIFQQLHFHWGDTNTQGTEHTIDGQKYALEMHIVHYNKKYGSFKKAKRYSDGLMVYTTFFKIHNVGNPFMYSLMSLVHKVPQYKAKANIVKPFSLMRLFPPFPKRIYRYYGSLTTPPCFQHVLFIICRGVATIGRDQMKEFRKANTNLKDALGRPILCHHNFRDVLPLNGRKIITADARR